MATFYRCDRCGFEVDTKQDMKRISIERDYDETAYSKELCKACYGQVVNFLNENPKKEGKR